MAIPEIWTRANIIRSSPSPPFLVIYWLARGCFHRWFRLHVSCSTWCHLAMIFIHFMFYRQLDCSTLYSFSSLWNANFVVVRNCDWMLRFHSAPWMLWLGRIWIKNLHAYGGAAEGAWLSCCYHSGAVWWWRFSVRCHLRLMEFRGIEFLNSFPVWDSKLKNVFNKTTREHCVLSSASKQQHDMSSTHLRPSMSN